VARSLILLAHGSRDPRHAEAVETITERVGLELGPAWSVTAAFLQFHGPTAAEALGTPRPSDAGVAVIQPLLLTAGQHWREDVPTFTSDLVSERAVQLLPPPDPVELTQAVLESLAPPTRRAIAVESRGPDTKHRTNEAGMEPRPADRARNTQVPDTSAMPIRKILLVPAGSSHQDLRQHFGPLAMEVNRSIRAGCGDQDDAQSGRLSVGSLSGPAEIPENYYPGQATQIVPLLVSTGRIFDSMAEAADKIGATVAPPIGETTAFARVIAARTIRHHQNGLT
jgi:sirohydrochlorin ferrochelatase